MIETIFVKKDSWSFVKSLKDFSSLCRADLSVLLFLQLAKNRHTLLVGQWEGRIWINAHYAVRKFSIDF